MTRDDIAWSGPMPALTTPFQSDGSLDLDGFAANIDRLYRAGATGMVVAGCTGEFWALTLAEKAALAETAIAATKGRGPVILGAAAITIDDVLATAAAAHAAGCDGILVTPPYFVRTTAQETIAHFQAIAARTPLPIVVYNIPGNAGNLITAEIASTLADLDPVVAIKESSGDWRLFHETLLATRDRIRVFCGPSSVYGVAATLAGADGLIDCFPNVWLGCLDIWSTTHDGRLQDAFALQDTGLALTHLFTSGGRTLYPATKAAMDALGLPGGGLPRPPLLPLKGAPLAELESALGTLLPDLKPAA
ncbi:MAG: dihydrodipicolinate synthase family protein [Pseudomonadota bacterium]